MRNRPRRWSGRLTTTTFSALAVLAAPTLQGPAQAGPVAPDRPLTVMTRNLYLGANIMRPVLAAASAPAGYEALALANASDVTRQIVDATSFPDRSRLLAAEIAEAEPDLVGLQEVALWRSGSLQLTGPQVGVPNATAVDYDFLQILLDDLAAAGQRYTAVSVQVQSDVEAPSFAGTPPAVTRPRDVRLTMRDVILMRQDSGLTLVGTGSGQYDARLTVRVAGMDMEFIRGYTWADVRVGNKKVRFINTHLEAFGSHHSLAQVKELLAGPASVRGATVVIACDCNSDPLEDEVSGGVAHHEPYDYIVGQGFTDQWLQWAPAAEGWTAGLSELVNDPDATAMDHRIDMIFARTPSGKPLGVVAGEVLGDEVSDRGPGGLWPSDHAGVVLTLAGKAG